MKYLLFSLLTTSIIFTNSCKKDYPSLTTHYREGYGYIDTAREIDLFIYYWGNNLNKIGMYGRTIAYGSDSAPYNLNYSIGTFTIDPIPNTIEGHKYVITYTGEGNFIDTSASTIKVKPHVTQIDNNGNPVREYKTITFQVNRNLLGKPIFEIYDIRKERLFSKVIASPRNIDIGFERDLNDVEDPQKIANTLNYFISKISTVSYHRNN